jgi:hypothetical protein
MCPFLRIIGLALVVVGFCATASASKIDRGTWQGLQYQRAEVCWAIFAIRPDLEQAGDEQTMESIIGSDPAFSRTVGAARNSTDSINRNKMISAVLGDIYSALRDISTNQVDLDRALAGCEDLKREVAAGLALKFDTSASDRPQH